MKSRFFLFIILFSTSALLAFGQPVRPIYNLTIYKSVNDEYHKPDKFIEIDSAGNIYVQSGTTYSPRVKAEQVMDIKNLAMEIKKYVAKEKPYKSPGDDFETKVEAPTVKLNEQYIEISIKFLDDIRRERKLLNKTYYTWNDMLDKNIKDYPLFNYLNISEITILKALLE
jgi:hypothetical protein